MWLQTNWMWVPFFLLWYLFVTRMYTSTIFSNYHQINRSLVRKYWAWQNSSLVLDSLVAQRIALIKLKLYHSWRTIGKPLLPNLGVWIPSLCPFQKYISFASFFSVENFIVHLNKISIPFSLVSLLSIDVHLFSIILQVVRPIDTITSFQSVFIEFQRSA
jgi:hypothetical protein